MNSDRKASPEREDRAHPQDQERRHGPADQETRHGPAGRDTLFDPGLHDMGGNIGPASIRGPNAAPGGKRDDDAEPRSGYSESMGYVAGRDDEWPETAGSDEKAVASRTDEIEPHVETPGPSPHPVPPDPLERQGHGDRPGYRVRGPAEGEEPGVIDEEEASPGTAAPGGDVADPAPAIPPTSDHVTADLDWVPDDEDDPDAGSGRTDTDDGGYLPGEATGRRPYRG